MCVDPAQRHELKSCLCLKQRHLIKHVAPILTAMLFGDDQRGDDELIRVIFCFLLDSSQYRTCFYAVGGVLVG
jgi:hypothetical protein